MIDLKSDSCEQRVCQGKWKDTQRQIIEFTVTKYGRSVVGFCILSLRVVGAFRQNWSRLLLFFYAGIINLHYLYMNGIELTIVHLNTSP